jgi:hypothetical protein
LGPLGTAATNRPLVPAPGDYDDGEIGGMNGRGNQSTRRKPAPVPLCVYKVCSTVCVDKCISDAFAVHSGLGQWDAIAHCFFWHVCYSAECVLKSLTTFMHETVQELLK